MVGFSTGFPYSKIQIKVRAPTGEGLDTPIPIQEFEGTAGVRVHSTSLFVTHMPRTLNYFLLYKHWRISNKTPWKLMEGLQKCVNAQHRNNLL